ncbi:ATP-binding protein [Clostridium butyricum]|nr:ATP-binding protein [Clostridium butyricum]
MEELKVLKNIVSINAEYKEQLIEEYKGNPFIEALPAIKSKEEVIESLSMYPFYNNDERKLDDHIRIHIISERLFNVFQPLPRHISLENRISIMIRNGYMSRNPLSKEYVEAFNDGFLSLVDDDYKNTIDHFNTANSLSIIGTSGMGKSSSLNRILQDIPQVILHSKYKDKVITMYQVTWIKLDCPFDGSVKGLCIDFFNKVDEILSTGYFKKYGTSKRTVDILLNVMGQVARNIGLGLLVIDEIQHLSQAKSGGIDKMLNFFTTLVNTVGIPVVLVGTMKARGLLENDFRMARRTLGTGGNIIWNRLENDESFKLLLDGIWEYQFTKKKTKLSDELLNLIYIESQGIIDIAVKIYAMAQIHAISTGKEEITVDIIKNVVSKNLKAVKPMLDALRSNDIRRIAKFEDICTLDYEDFVVQNNKDVNLTVRINEFKEAKERKQHNKKNEALIRLIELGINKRKAEIVLNEILVEDSTIGLNKLIIESIKRVDEVKVSKKNKYSYHDNDIRQIIKDAKMNNIGVYEALKEKNYIVTADIVEGDLL